MIASIVGRVITGKLLVVAAVAVVALVSFAMLAAYNRGVAADKQRSDLAISQMQLDAANRLNAATLDVLSKNEALRLLKQGADRVLLEERETNATRAAADAAVAGQLRDQLSSFARGASGVVDTVTACREDAAALGDVLDRALQTSRVCAGAAEDLASDTRALLSAWPVVPAPR